MRLLSTDANIKSIKGGELKKQILEIIEELSQSPSLQLKEAGFTQYFLIHSVLNDIKKNIPLSIDGWHPQNAERSLIDTCKLVTNLEFEQAMLRLPQIAKLAKKAELIDAIDFAIRIMGIQNRLSCTTPSLSRKTRPDPKIIKNIHTQLENYNNFWNTNLETNRPKNLLQEIKSSPRALKP